MGVLRGIDRRDTFPGRVKSVRSDGERVLLFGPAITTPLQEVCSIRGKPSPPGGGSAFCLGRSLGYNDHRRFAHFPGTMEGGALPGTHRLPPFWPRTGTFCDRRHKYFHELSGMVETARSCTVATGEGLCPSVHRPRGAAACPAIDGGRGGLAAKTTGDAAGASFEETAGALNGMVSLHVSGNVRPLGIQQRV